MNPILNTILMQYGDLNILVYIICLFKLIRYFLNNLIK